MSAPGSPEGKPVRAHRFDPTDWIFWTRALTGLAAGLLSGMMGFITPNPDAWMGILFAIAIYAVTYYLSRYVFAPDLPKGQGHKYVTLGIGSFIMLFLFIWIVYNTLVNYPLG